MKFAEFTVSATPGPMMPDSIRKLVLLMIAAMLVPGRNKATRNSVKVNTSLSPIRNISFDENSKSRLPPRILDFLNDVEIENRDTKHEMIASAVIPAQAGIQKRWFPHHVRDDPEGSVLDFPAEPDLAPPDVRI